MVKKLFALASVSALTGLVAAGGAAGCSSSTDNNPTNVTPDGGGAADAKKDGKTGVTPEEDSGDGDGPSCWKEDAIDATKAPYQPPRIQAGACTSNVLKVINDLIDSNAQATFDDLKAEIETKESAKCAECVFGENGDTWAPIVTESDKVVALNGGGCVEIVSGKESCGRAYQQWDTCLDFACTDCKDSADRQACTKDVQSTACKDATEALVTECGQKTVDGYLGQCFKAGELTIAGPITKQCVTGGTVKDASTD
jgi:hypothetical protein